MTIVTSPRTQGLSQSFFLQDESRPLEEVVKISFTRSPLSEQTVEKCKKIFQEILESNKERIGLLSSQELVDHLFSLYRDVCVNYLTRTKEYRAAVTAFAGQVPWFNPSVVEGIAKGILQKYIHTYYQGLASVAIAELLGLPFTTTRVEEFVLRSPLVADFDF